MRTFITNDLIAGSIEEKGTEGAIELKQRLLRENPQEYIDVDQFADPADVLAHYQTTGKEILEQTRKDLRGCFLTFSDSTEETHESNFSTLQPPVSQKG